MLLIPVPNRLSYQHHCVIIALNWNGKFFRRIYVSIPCDCDWTPGWVIIDLLSRTDLGSSCVILKGALEPKVLQDYVPLLFLPLRSATIVRSGWRRRLGAVCSALMAAAPLPTTPHVPRLQACSWGPMNGRLLSMWPAVDTKVPHRLRWVSHGGFCPASSAIIWCQISKLFPVVDDFCLALNVIFLNVMMIWCLPTAKQSRHEWADSGPEGDL